MTNPLLVCPPCFIRSTARKHVSALWFYQESTCFFPMSDIQTPLYIKELTSSQIKSKILISLWELDSIFYHLNGPCLHQITGYHHIFLISIQKKNYLFSILLYLTFAHENISCISFTFYSLDECQDIFLKRQWHATCISFLTVSRFFVSVPDRKRKKKEIPRAITLMLIYLQKTAWVFSNGKRS